MAYNKIYTYPEYNFFLDFLLIQILILSHILLSPSLSFFLSFSLSLYPFSFYWCPKQVLSQHW